MARKKVETEEVKELEQVETVVEETVNKVEEDSKEEVIETKVDKKYTELEETKRQNQELQNTILEMQQMMLQMQMQLNAQNIQQVQKSNNKNTVAVKSYTSDLIGLCMKDGHNELASFSTYGEVKKIPCKSFDDAILDERNRRFFELGVLGFVNESDYEEYDFATIPQVISIEYIESLLQKDEETVFSTLDELTANKKNSIMVSAIFTNIVNSIDNITIKGSLVSKLNRYFGVDIYKMANNYFLYNYHKQGKVSIAKK